MLNINAFAVSKVVFRRPAVSRERSSGKKVRSEQINRSISPPTNSALSMLTSKKLFSLEFQNSRISFCQGTNFQVSRSLTGIYQLVRHTILMHSVTFDVYVFEISRLSFFPEENTISN